MNVLAVVLLLTLASFAQVPKAESVVLDNVRINGVMWRVVIGDLSKDLDAGHCYYDLHLIYIDRNSVAAERPGILMHEVMHAIIGKVLTAKQANGHQFIEDVSPDLTRVLRDNPALVKYLVRKDVKQ